MKFVSHKYGLIDPSECLKSDPPPKFQYKETIITKITAYYENNLRVMASNNSRMTYLNISLSGLRGYHHPALSDILTSHDVKKSRIHIKMLAGDYFTYEIKSKHSGGGPQCRCCQYPSPPESISHVLASCNAYNDIRQRMFPHYNFLCTQSKSKIDFNEISSDGEKLCQFILDPTSCSLTSRIHVTDPILKAIFRLSRDYCYAVNAVRMRMLRSTTNQNIQNN